MSSTDPAAEPSLVEVTIATGSVDAAAGFLATVCGSHVDPDGLDPVIPVGPVDLRIVGGSDGEGSGSGESGTGGSSARGVQGVRIAGGTGIGGHHELNGVVVEIVDAGERPPNGGRRFDEPAEVRVDHVAVAVEDLAASAAEWGRVVGVEPTMMGPHPISGGAFEAARLPVGPRMLELVAPVPGRRSAVATRIERAGEGALVLAMPADDLDATRRRLESAGVELLFNEPHWLVHPANPARVMVQLTPRVEH